MPRVHLNGEAQTLEPDTSVATLVEGLVADMNEGVAVAINGVIVRRAQWSTREVQDGDDIEIVRAVQGG